MPNPTELGQSVNRYLNSIGIELKRPAYVIPSHEYNGDKCFLI